MNQADYLYRTAGKCHYLLEEADRTLEIIEDSVRYAIRLAEMDNEHIEQWEFSAQRMRICFCKLNDYTLMRVRALGESVKYNRAASEARNTLASIESNILNSLVVGGEILMQIEMHIQKMHDDLIRKPTTHLTGTKSYKYGKNKPPSRKIFAKGNNRIKKKKDKNKTR